MLFWDSWAHTSRAPQCSGLTGTSLPMFSGATLAVLAVLVGLDALSSVIDEVDDLSADHDFLDVLVYVGFSLPRRLRIYPVCCPDRGSSVLAAWPQPAN